MNIATMPFDPERLLPRLDGLSTRGTWWVAFSGGSDSTALLHALWVLRGRLPVALRALHVDHGIHPASREWSAHCARFCQDLELPLHIEEVEVTREQGKGIEAEARRLRYGIAEKLMGAGDVLLTAHHADDQAETVILNLMRGSGVDGLAGMPEIRPIGNGVLARPLLPFTGASLRDYLRSYPLNWIEDQSNLDLDYDRNFVRHSLLPALEKRWPGARRNLGLSANHCRDASEFIAETCNKALDACRAGSGRLNLAGLQSHAVFGKNAEYLALLIRQWLKVEGASNLPGTRLRELLRQLDRRESDHHTSVNWDGWVLHLYHDELWLQPQASIRRCPVVDWCVSRPIDLGPGLGSLRLAGATLPDWTVHVGPRRGGEKIASMSGGHHRSVKQLFQEWGIPPWLRESVPLLWLGRELVAVGDRLLSQSFTGQLQRRELQLRWEPNDPVLAAAFKYRHDQEG